MTHLPCRIVIGCLKAMAGNAVQQGAAASRGSNLQGPRVGLPQHVLHSQPCHLEV